MLALDVATTITSLGVVVIALIGPLLTYLGLRHGKSGRVNSTEAETLWAEATTMRTLYRDEASNLRVELLTMREEVLNLRRQVAALRERLREAEAEAGTSRAADGSDP